MELILYRCSICSNAKLFTKDQVKDFPGGLVCGMITDFNEHCIGLMERTTLSIDIWGEPMIQLKAK